MAKALADMTADELTAFEQKLDKAASTPAGNLPPALSDMPFRKGGVPGVATGAFGEDSKRFSLTNFFVNGLCGVNPDKAKFEIAVMDRMRKSLDVTGSRLNSAGAASYWLPYSWDQLPDAAFENEDGVYYKSVMSASNGGYDPDEASWLVRKGYVHDSSVRKAQSAYTDVAGGSLVAPPTMGEIIPLVRPQAAFLKAGARSMALPPSGRFVRPRITVPTTAQALGEAQTTPASTLGTNQMVMQAKKIGGAAYISEEATNFTSGTIDNLVQSDLAYTLALKMDLYAFYGVGGTEMPAGITSSVYNSTTAGASATVNVVVDYPGADGIGAQGNEILPQYGDQFPTLIYERSFGTDAGGGAWIMRPAALSRARSKRASAVAIGDQEGPFVDILKKFTDSPSQNQFAGHRAIQTTNLKNTLTKGNATDLSDAFFGLWQYAIMGTYGAVQFQKGHDGNTFLNGQYIIRGTLWGDVGFEYPQAFLWYTQVLGAAGLIS
jgi:hypothetical protein